MSKPIRAVGRALDVLLCFSHEEPELTLTEISERVGLHKSTVHRVLATLEHGRFVQHDASTGKYRLGLRLLELASLVLEHVDFRRQARPFLYRLAEKHREAVDLGVLDGMDIVYLEMVETPQRVKVAAAPGRRLPVHCTGSGKAIMAFLPDDRVEEILNHGLSRHTANTILSSDDLREDLRRTRERGFAISQEEFEEGINAVAAPVMDANGPVAVVALVGPAYRLPLERMLELGPSVKATADLIARETGLAVPLASGVNQIGMP